MSLSEETLRAIGEAKSKCNNKIAELNKRIEECIDLAKQLKGMLKDEKSKLSALEADYPTPITILED